MPLNDADTDTAIETQSERMPGPSTNPATNLLIADLVVRGVTRMTRQTLHKSVLRTGYSREKARKLANDHTILSTLALYGLSKLATRSVPGALLVGGGLLAKTLYDRGKSRRVNNSGDAPEIVPADPTANEEK